MSNVRKYTAGTLKVYAKYENDNCKTSTTFSNCIRNVPIEDDKIIVSFDVTFLDINIAIIDTLNKIKGYFINVFQYTRKTAISQDKFLDLGNVVLTTT